MSFPSGLSSIEFAPFFPVEAARDDAGNVWETRDADPYWQGRASTGKLDFAKLQDWDGFMLEAMLNRTVIEFVDPVFYIPAAYRGGALPGGFSGTGSIVNLTDPLNPVVAGLPVGLVLRRGDRVGFADTNNKTCHVISANITVSSNTMQALKVVPPVLPNVFGASDDVVLLNPVLRLNVEPNSWSVPRRARQDAIGTFSVIEAGIVT